MSTYGSGFRVQPLSIIKIRQVAAEVRKILDKPRGSINMASLLEHVFPEMVPGFEWEIVEDSKLGRGEHARTYPETPKIVLRESVYDRLVAKDGQARFTLAHEIGHMVLHRNKVVLSRHPGIDFKIYECSEWQADQFAAEFLMPFNEALECRTEQEVMDRFLVSYSAARNRLKKVRKERPAK